MSTGDESSIIRVSGHSERAYLGAFWEWIAIMATDDFDAAISAVLWGGEEPPSAKDIKHLISMLYGDTQWMVVIPNERVVAHIKSCAEITKSGNGQPWGHFFAHIPITDDPDRAKEDDTYIFAVAVEIEVVPHDGYLAMQYCMMHI